MLHLNGAQVPKVKGMAALGNEALFKRFGCDKGVFLTRWGNASLFNFATPPFPDKVSQRVLMTGGSGMVRKMLFSTRIFHKSSGSDRF